MNLLSLSKLGPHVINARQLSLGLYLPWISARQGNRLSVKIIHEKDQFIQSVQPKQFDLEHSIDHEYGDYWSATITIDEADKDSAGEHWGEQGRYVYRFALNNPNTPYEIDWIIDPFAREFGPGKLSAVTLGYEAYKWSDNEKNWKVPRLKDLIIYEMMISEFGQDIDGAIEKLDYLKDLGINCLEIMPVSNVSNNIDWGFLPIGYFGVDERFGKRRDFQRFVDEAHQRGIAVMLDVVYGHTSDQFPYSYVYRQLNYHENPFMGAFAKDYFGESTDFNRKLTQDYFFTVNMHWLDCYHVDGFRYDCVPNYWDGSVGKGYANMTYSSYQYVKDRQGEEGWQRFFDGDKNHLIQCAEQLEGPVEIIEQTYSNCTWQNETLGAAKHAVDGQADELTELGQRLGLMGYPDVVKHNQDELEKSALQYIENHDHERFVCHFGMNQKDNSLLQDGDRSKWYKVQPYLIAIMTARGLPLLWQGQELGENYFVPWSGWGRVMLLRPVRWDYFYDTIGQSMVKLTRKLTALRKAQVQLRQGGHYFYNHYDHYQSKRVLVYSRSRDDHFTLIALNFSDQPQWIPFVFEQGGDYIEQLHGQEEDQLNIKNIQSGQQHWLELPGNYGRIWTKA